MSAAIRGGMWKLNMKVFRPSFVGSIIVMFCGTLFVLVGAGGLVVGIQDGRTDWGGYLFFLGFFVAGLFCLLAGTAQLTFRVAVDPTGMAQSSWLGCIVHRDSWESLKSWMIGKAKDDDIPDPFFVSFDFEGRRGPARIEASLVFNLGFEAFVKEIRSHAASKELVNDIAKDRKESHFK